jgi:hypothetical protein
VGHHVDQVPLEDGEQADEGVAVPAGERARCCVVDVHGLSPR